MILSIVIGLGGLIYNLEAGEKKLVLQTGPQPVYQPKGRRDPFLQPWAGKLHKVTEQVDIENLKLTGIIRNPQRALALFSSRTGPKFGYLLKGDRLYRENFQPVPEITGEVSNPQKVILRQGDREIIFRLD
jgi:hypothetical protein